MSFLTMTFQDRAIAAQELAFEKTAGVGTKIDIALTLIRIGFFFGDHSIITSNTTRAEECVHIILTTLCIVGT